MSELKSYPNGYMKPPKQYQFKPGKSGNPGGRPKQKEDPYMALQKTLKRKVRVNNEGRKIPIDEALMRRLRELALSGNRRAIQMQQSIIGMANELSDIGDPDADVMGAKLMLAELAGIDLDFDDDDYYGGNNG